MMLGEEGLAPLLTHPLIHIDDLHELLGREQVDKLLASGLLLPTTEPGLYQLSYTHHGPLYQWRLTNDSVSVTPLGMDSRVLLTASPLARMATAAVGTATRSP